MMSKEIRKHNDKSKLVQTIKTTVRSIQNKRK